MKSITIKVVVSEDKIATVWQTEGLSRESISDNLEIIGILENTKNIINNKIKTLMEKKI